jgi:hypothetical protein
MILNDSKGLDEGKVEGSSEVWNRALKEVNELIKKGTAMQLDMVRATMITSDVIRNNALRSDQCRWTAIRG